MTKKSKPKRPDPAARPKSSPPGEHRQLSLSSSYSLEGYTTVTAKLELASDMLDTLQGWNTLADAATLEQAAKLAAEASLRLSQLAEGVKLIALTETGHVRWVL